MRFSIESLTSHGSSHILLAAVLFGLILATRLALVPTHSLGISAASWFFVFLYSFLNDPSRNDVTNDARRRRCWAIGFLISFAQTCIRADGGGRDFWWLWGFLPITVLILRWLDFGDHPSPSSDLDKPYEAVDTTRQGSKRSLAIFTIAAYLVLHQPFSTAPSTTLGLCSVLLIAMSYILLERVLIAREDHYPGTGGFVSANGSLSRRRSMSVSGTVLIASMRDIATTAALGCGLAALYFESFRTDAISWTKRFEGLQGQDWRRGQWRIHLAQGVVASMSAGIQNILLLALVRNQGALPVALVQLSATLLANVFFSTSLFGLYFTGLAIVSIYLFAIETTPSATPAFASRTSRFRQILSILSIFSFAAFTIVLLRNPTASRPTQDGFLILQPEREHDPIPMSSDSPSHPLYQLVSQAESEFESQKASQSKTLNEAVAEYRRRYKIPPPPNFDKWFQFAKSKNVQLVDEFDSIFDAITPFWALDPSTIRSRARETIGFRNAMIAVSIRDGEVRKIEGGDEWQQQGTTGMMASFVKYLPDMDLAFNTHDEPRVILGHDDLIRLVTAAKDVTMPTAFDNPTPKNAFSPRPSDVNNGKSFAEVKLTRFNEFAHQATWTNSRVSCPPSSPARSLSENPKDNLTAYAATPLGFIYNVTAFSDICYTPSLQSTYGFFNRPNAYSITRDLFPVFSQSKTSSYQDLVYPSPWYWYGKVAYDEERAVDWSEKKEKMYWRGSTTGGFSRNGGWRRQHRQRVVKLVNAHDEALVMSQPDKRKPWVTEKKPKTEFADLFDVLFSHVGQCDEGDCNAQREAFNIAPEADQQDAWGYKHLLDMDGNAFSGRFYAFLKSKSLIYKMAVFREWHMEWLKPWVHYVPLSLRGDEWVETVRWFSNEGKAEAERLALSGHDWAEKVLRKEDLEVWFFRLLLEYGRVIDDNRDVIGYAGP